jgi:transcription antitermination factor NusA-like protein
VCAISGVLCQVDEERYRSGLVNDDDINLTKNLFLIEHQYPELKDLIFLKSYRVKGRDGGEVIIALVSHPQPLNNLFLSALSKQLTNKMGVDVRVVEQSKNIKKMISQIFDPAQVYGVSIMWLPDGSIEYDIMIHKRELKRIIVDLEDLRRVFKNMIHESIRFTII